MMTSQAQESVYPKLTYTNLTTIAVAGDNIFASGSCNTAQISTDAGLNWEILSIDNNSYLYDMEIIPNTNGEQCYLIDRDGLYSLNIDKSFSVLNTQAIDIYGKFLGLEIDDDYIYIISTGAINRAPHGSLVWELVNEVIYDTPYTISATSSSPSNIYVANRDGQIFQINKSSGGYEEIVNLGSFIQKLDMASDEVGYLTMSGQSGPWKTIDGGNSWTSVTNWPENNPVYVYNENIFLTSNTNRFFVSQDGGNTVASHYIYEDEQAGLIKNVIFTEDGTIYLVGESSTILRSDDFGETYENLIPLNRSSLNSIDLTSTSGIACGYQSIVITEDGGINWSPYSNTELMQVDEAVVLDQGKYALAGEGGVSILEDGIIVSTAGAAAYRIFNSEDNSYLLAGMNIGGSHVISKSIDNGLSWSNKIFSDDYIGKIKINEQGILYASAGESGYLRSIDNGDSWEMITVPVSGWMADMVLTEDEAILAIGSNIYKSNDGLTNFNSIASGSQLNNLHILSTGHYTYTTGSSSQTSIYERTPDANNFTKVKEWCGTSYGSYNANGTIWYSKAGGHINNYTFTLSTSTIDHSKINHNVYPNPVVQGENLFITGIEGLARVEVFNNIGIPILRLRTVENDISIKTNTFLPGKYYINITTATGTSTSKVIIL